MRVAALDLGSNTFLCLIAEVDQNQILEVVCDEVQVVRLGQGMSKSDPSTKPKFHPEALLRAEKCLQDFSQLIQRHRPEKILAMATSAARDASNSQELFEICRKLSIPLEIIPGGLEAQITFQGSISGNTQRAENFCVIDIGGGSTEIILGNQKQVRLAKSLNIGCVRLTEKFLPFQPATELQRQDLQKQIESEIGSFRQQVSAADLNPQPLALAVAGTPTELARIEFGAFDPKKIDGFQLTQQKLQQRFEEFKICSSEQIQQRYGVSTGRADLILVGVMILQEFCRQFGFEAVEVSTRGVRYGVALEIEKRERNKK